MINSLISKAVNSLSVILLVSILSFMLPRVSADRLVEKRVPAEWEPQEAIWLQWPGPYEGVFQPAFAQMAGIISRYQKLNILYNSSPLKTAAEQSIKAAGSNPDHENINWHRIPNDNAWMRDNGPVYVIENGELRIQNWEFNAWGGAFGDQVPYYRDNRVPSRIGDRLNLPVDMVGIVHERGNLEFNGVDSVLLNWSTIGDPRRNPGYTRKQAEQDLKRHFGVSKVIMVEGVPAGDLTRGHIDGFARFINPTTVVVSQCTSASKCRSGDDADGTIYDNAARIIQNAGFNVIRDPILGQVEYRGENFDTNYLNWLVGNGFVIAVGFGNPITDSAAKKRIQGYFPGRDVFIVEMLESWHNGGGVHCHTNDQPKI